MAKLELKNKLVVITGAAGNLGRELCWAFALAGAKIGACDIDANALAALSAEFSAKNISIATATGDICQRQICLEMMADIRAQMQGATVAVLINNAGISHIQPFLETDPTADIERKVMSVNYFGAVNCTQAALDDIIDNQGVIVAISSIAGFSPLVGRTAYAASKHALHGFFSSLRAELQPKNVQCLLVCPSFVGASANISNPTSAIYQQKKTVGQNLTPDFVAAQVLTAVVCRRRLLVLGRMGKVAYWLHRFFPALYESQMRKRF
jgi:short-subunit dehydrogenase